MRKLLQLLIVLGFTGILKGQSDDWSGVWISNYLQHAEIELPDIRVDSFDTVPLDCEELLKEAKMTEEERQQAWDMKMERIDSVYAENLRKYRDSLKIADYYSPFYSIFQILSSHRINYVRLDAYNEQDSVITLKWERLSDTSIRILTGPYDSTVIWKTGNRLCWEQASDSLTYSRVYFSGAGSGPLPTNEKIDSILSGNSFEITWKPDTVAHHTNFLFLDKHTGYADVYFQGDYYPIWLRIWKVVEYFGEQFLIISDNFYPMPYHILQVNDSKIQTEGAFFSDFDEPPFHINCNFRKTEPFPELQALDEKHLLGHWVNSSEVFHYDSTSLIYHAVDSAYLTLDFSETGIVLIKMGGYVTHFERRKITRHFTGTWNLYTQMRVLVIQSDNRGNYYDEGDDWLAFVQCLSENELVLNMKLIGLDGHWVDYQSIKFRRQRD